MTNYTDKSSLRSILETRVAFLKRVIANKRKQLAHAAEGSLYVSRNAGKVRYYYKEDVKNPQRHYLGRDRLEFAQKLAQKVYDRKVLEAAEKEYRMEAFLIQFLERNCLEDIYQKFPAERRELIQPVVRDPDAIVKEWLEVSYQGKDFFDRNGEHYSLNGERVRSKSEALIADALLKYTIPYRYEYPLYLEGMGMIHPDFTVLNVRDGSEVIWEHFGRMDDPDYAEGVVRKMEIYARNGYFPGERLIVTFETGNHPLHVKMIEQVIRNYLNDE